jgi:hypothetical protein
MKTKGFIENAKLVGLSSQDKSLKVNDDGTIDIYFGPKALAVPISSVSNRPTNECRNSLISVVNEPPD